MSGFFVGRFHGTEVRMNLSVIAGAVLMVVTLAESLFPDIVDGRADSTYWTWAIGTTLVFLVTLAAHDVAHAITARRYGVAPASVTVWMFGGASRFEGHPETQSATRRIASAGPTASAIIGVSFFALSLLFDGLTEAAMVWLALTNLILAGVNLLPLYPLDGARLYTVDRAERASDVDRAVRETLDLGFHASALLVGIGFVELIVGSEVAGAWLLLSGWFIREASSLAWLERHANTHLAHIAVRQVMTTHPVHVSADATLESFIAGVLFGGRHAAYPVENEDGSVTGLLVLNDLRAVPRAEMGDLHVADVAIPLADLVTATPNEPISTLLDRMESAGQRRALVFDGDALVGIVAPTDITRLLTVVDMIEEPPAVDARTRTS